MKSAWARILFWVVIIALVVLSLDLLSSILLPFALGVAIAFSLNPLVTRMARARISRLSATLIVIFGFLVVIVAMALLLLPLLEAQVAKLINHFPQYLDQAKRKLNDGLLVLQNHLSDEDVQRIRDAATSSVSNLLGGVGSVVTHLLTGGVAVANLLSLVFITPIVAFFLLRDWQHIIALLDSWMPRQHLGTIRELAHEIGETLSGFLLGQASVSVLLGVFYALGLSALRIESGLVVGFCVGFLLFIPFLGGLAGGLIAVALAFAQYGTWEKPFYVLLLFLVGQALEGNVITPKLVGDRVNLHPLWIIFALLAFGALFGFVGVLVAVPAAAVIGVLMRFAIRQYLLSPLYDPLNGPPRDSASQDNVP